MGHSIFDQKCQTVAQNQKWWPIIQQLFHILSTTHLRITKFRNLKKLLHIYICRYYVTTSVIAGANPTIVSYNAASSLVRFKNKNIFF
jgi:hypothetical protein